MTFEVKRLSQKEALDVVRSRKPRGIFYTVEDGEFVGIDNRESEAWVESFDTLQKCISWLKGEYVELSTFPDDDDCYCKDFMVPTDWLISVLEKMGDLNERKGVDLQNFLDNYCWHETYAIYEMAKAGNHLIKEEEQE